MDLNKKKSIKQKRIDKLDSDLKKFEAPKSKNSNIQACKITNFIIGRSK